MPTFDELKNKYMFTGTVTSTSSGSSSIGSSSPTTSSTTIPIHTQNTITPLIDGPAYFAEVKAKLNALNPARNAFFYIHGWWFHRSFSLDGQSSSSKAVDLLKSRSHDGVDVRVMGWVSAPELMNSSLAPLAGGQVLGLLGLNNQTMGFIQALRAEPTLQHKAVCNILTHPAGAAHLKMCVLGDDDQAYAFTGGIDWQSYRHNVAEWHDVQTKVEGVGARGVYDYYRDMWEEIRGRNVVSLVNPSSGGLTLNSHSTSMPSLPARSVGRATTGKIHVQSGRTLPQFRFASGIINSATLPTNTPLSFAPNGLFAIKEMWHKGIAAADNYIYIEDQAFWSYEVSAWLNAQIKARDNLKVILLRGIWDPNDSPNNTNAKIFVHAINNHLLAGLTPAQRDRICLVRHDQKVIHAKTTIVDEQWSLIGSANYMRRSLYSDFENSYGFMDEDNQAVPRYRQDLWDFHFGAPEPDLTRAIARWFALSTTTSTRHMTRVALPMANMTISPDEQQIIDEIQDFDSREVWGNRLLSIAVSQAGAAAVSTP